MYKVNLRKRVRIAMLIVAMLSLLLPCRPASAGFLTVTVNAAASGGQFTDVLGTKNVWDIRAFDNAHVGAEPNGFIKQWYPYLNYLNLYFFTGGKGPYNNGALGPAYNNWYTEDAMGNPQYHFSLPLEILRNVVRGGVKPVIVISQMPNDLSTVPSDMGDSNYWGNRYPPKDYTKYYNYMKAFAHELVAEFGTNEIKTWKFRFYTEGLLNTSIWMGTVDEFLKLYDYTEAALASEIGESNLYFFLGNIWSNVPGWTNESVLDYSLNHFANGTNYYTGALGTKCDEVSYSCYFPSTNCDQFSGLLSTMWTIANRYPSVDIKTVNLGECGFLYGYDNRPLQVAQGITEEYGSAMARLFEIGNGPNKGYASIWEYVSDFNNWDINSYSAPYLHTPASNAAWCAGKLLSGQRISSTLSGTASNGNLVGQLASVDPANNKIYVLVYNHNATNGDTGTESVTVNLNNITPASGSDVTLKHWRVDHNTSNFATTWLAESASFVRRTDRLWGPGTGGGSVYDTAIQIFLYDTDKAFYLSRKPYYDTIDHLATCEADSNVTVVSNSISKSLSMPHHSVSLLEISNVKSISPTPTATPIPGSWNTVEESNASVVYSGAWTSENRIEASGGTIKYSNTANNYTQLTFTGTDVKWIGSKQFNLGYADVYIDDILQASNVDCYNSTTQNQVELFTKSGLSNGPHTIKIVVKGTKNASSAGVYVIIDAFKYATLTPGPTPTVTPIPGSWNTVEESTASVVYSGVWTSEDRTAASGGTIKFSNTANNYVQLPFTGTDVKWIGSKQFNLGYADVYIDDTLQASNIDCYNSTTQDQVELFTKSGLSNGPHTIKIGVKGTKNAGSADVFVIVDAFKYATFTGGSPAPTPTSTPTPTTTPGSNLVTNPGFEADGAATQNPTGWSTSGTAPDADYTEGPTGGGSPHTGAYHLVHWKSTSYQVYTYQTKTGLANGLYTLKAWIKNDYGNLGTAYMEAKDFGGSSMTYNIPTVSAWTQISITNINVTNGQCTIGFYSNTPATYWYIMDDVEFYKQ